MSIRRITCFIVACDECHADFDVEGGDYVVHFDTAAEAERYATEEAAWLITTDGRHMCGCCWARYTCTLFGHLYTDWQPCACNGTIPDHETAGCGFWRACHRQGCWFHEDIPFAHIPTTDEPDRSR